jgi:hypothetical protein
MAPRHGGPCLLLILLAALATTYAGGQPEGTSIRI